MTVFKNSLLFLLLVFIMGCAGKKATTEPASEDSAVQPPRLDVAADPGMYKAVKVIKDFGKITKKHLSHAKFQKTKKIAVFDPDIFYDHYILDLNEKNYWITITFRSAVRAIEKDPRIEKLMVDLPRNVIDVKLKTPRGNSFVLSDSDADGVLDFASPAGKKKKPGETIDLNLLKNMQGKYRWILGIIKRHYKKK